MSFTQKTDNLNETYENYLKEGTVLKSIEKTPEFQKVMKEFEKEVQKVASFVRKFNKEQGFDTPNGKLSNLKIVMRKMEMATRLTYSDVE